MIEQMSIFDGHIPVYKITKPIRLIELFAGIGSQHQALKNIGFEIDSSLICEWSVQSTRAYNNLHTQNYTDYSQGKTKEWLVDFLHTKGVSTTWNEPLALTQLNRKPIKWLARAYDNIIATNNLVNIKNMKGDDLNIVDTEQYTYILTYSFPCQDLSLAGLGKGMHRDGQTRSGMLWEVERLLKETKHLPHVLLMENVPEVIGQKNKEHFREWELFLRNLGYSNHCELLNSKYYKIPQSRNRCFMVSILGNWLYKFPPKQPSEPQLQDLLEDEVDEKYFLTDEQMINTTYQSGKFESRVQDIKGISSTLLARDGSGPKCIIVGGEMRTDEGIRTFKDNLMGTLRANDGCGHKIVLKIKQATKDGFAIAEEGDGVYIDRPHQKRGVVQKGMDQTIKTSGNDLGVVVKGGAIRNRPNDEGKNEPHIELRKDDISNAITTFDKDTIVEIDELSIRKYTPKECWRLMGFTDEQFNRVSKHQSNSTLYHLAGDSIVVNVLEEIFKQLK